MNKLEKLYESIRTLEELSIPLNPETLKAVDELEEKIIKDEILPTLSEQVTPLLKPIQRDLVLVLEYHPGEEISVALSRKVKVAEMLGAKTIEKEDDQQPDVAAAPTIPATTVPITTIPIAGVPFSVEFPDKEVIAEKKAVTTFVKSLQKFGLDKVQKLDINFSGYNLVSDVPCPLRGNSPLQHYVDGKYIFVNLSNAVKIKTIQKIASKLGINVLIQSV